jgi:hypothetical protein
MAYEAISTSVQDKKSKTVQLIPTKALLGEALKDFNQKP